MRYMYNIQGDEQILRERWVERDTQRERNKDKIERENRMNKEAHRIVHFWKMGTQRICHAVEYYRDYIKSYNI